MLRWQCIVLGPITIAINLSVELLNILLQFSYMFPLFCLLLTFDDDDDGDNDNDHKGVDFIVGLNRFKTDGNFLDALLGNRCHVIRFSLKDEGDWTDLVINL